MRPKQTLTIIAFLAVTTSALIQPTDLIDEVTKQIDDLKQIVSGEILSSHNSINSILTEFERTCTGSTNNGIIGLEQGHYSVFGQIQELKFLAESAGKDPSACVSESEETFADLTSRYTELIMSCVRGVSKEANRRAESSKYVIDISYSTVNHLEYEIAQCREEFLCISPILTEVELSKIKLPQNIRAQLQEFEWTVHEMKLATNSCPNVYLSSYMSAAYALLADVSKCIDDLLN